MNLKEKAQKLTKDIPAVFLALKDRQTPLSAKILSAIAVSYALSPVDLIPDFIPVIGYLDDLIILPLLIALIIKLIPVEVWKRCQERAENMWKDGKPKKFYYVIPVILFWILIILLAVKAICFKK